MVEWENRRMGEGERDSGASGDCFGEGSCAINTSLRGKASVNI